MRFCNLFLICCVSSALTTHRFKIFWNVPSERCSNFTLDPEYVIFNQDHAFRGSKADKIVILYEQDFGDWPSIKHNQNGNIPQNGDLKRHLRKAETDLQRLVPDPHFDGIIILDMELWNYIYTFNWGEKIDYKHASLKFIKHKVRHLKTVRARALAAREFDAAAKNFIHSTIKLIKKSRPSAKLGVYNYPFLPTTIGNTRWPEFATYAVKKGNDDLSWMYEELDYLMPSLYLSFSDDEHHFKHIRGILDETIRIQHKFGNRHHIIAYEKFEHKLYEKGETHFYSSEELCDSITLARQMGVEGIILWSTDAHLNARCGQFANFIHYFLMPFLENEVRQADECAAHKCNNRGICFTVKPYHSSHCKAYDYDDMYCKCDHGYHGRHCNKH